MHEMCAFFVCRSCNSDEITALTIICIVHSNQLIHVLVYPVKRASSFNELLSNRDWKDHLIFSDSSSAHLRLNMSPNSRKRGGFKLAYFGTSNPPLFGSSPAICAKQSFYTKQVERCDGSSMTVRQDIPYDSIKQAQDLIMEIACLNWAQALLAMVYAFIDEWSEAQARGSGKSKAIDIPNMRFVQAGLAIEQVQLGAEARCFLLEELISNSEKGGSFRKYLNNTSSKPCRFKNADDTQRAEFLAFAQHVQYFKTKKRAYVADFQGIFIIHGAVSQLNKCRWR